MRCVITGHRTSGLNNGMDNKNLLECPFYYEIANILRKYALTEIHRIQSEGKGEKFIMITGMASGIDTVWGLMAKKLKLEFPDIVELECYIPFRNHKPKNTYNRKKYEAITAAADIVHMVCDEDYEKDGIKRPWLLTNRNHVMVDSMTDEQDVLVAVFYDNGSKKGGTRECINYGKKHHKQIMILEPYTHEITWENRKDIK